MSTPRSPKRSPTLPNRRLAALALGAAALLGACSSEAGSQTTTSTSSTSSTSSPSASSTPSAPPAPVVRVAAAGDIACEPGLAVTAAECQMEATASLVEAFDPSVVLPLGDLQYEYGELENFRASYEQSWGRLRSITRPVVGNHEYAGGRAAGYFTYWGAAAAPPNGWYSFDIPEVGWRVVVVNSVCSVVGCGEGSAQLTWLREQLASSPACTAIAMHHPRYTSGLHGDDASLDPVWSAAADGGADVVLGGHDHHYERLVVEPGGPRQFVVGTGGRNLYPTFLAREGSEFIHARHFGILELDLRAGSYGWRFRAIGDAGVLDSGTADCR